MAFIKNFRCQQCGSSLGKWKLGAEHSASHCFTCCAAKDPVIPLHAWEMDGLVDEEIKKLTGREPGFVTEIHSRLHSVNGYESHSRNEPCLYDDPDAPQMYQPVLIGMGLNTVVEVPLGEPDINNITLKVIEGMVLIGKEKKNERRIPNDKDCSAAKGPGCSSQDSLCKHAGDKVCKGSKR